MSPAYLVSGGTSQQRQERIFTLYRQVKPDSQPLTDPDTKIIESPKQKAIGLEEINQIGRHLSLKPYQKPPKVVLVFAAERLTFEAQNKFLKLLEEPPGQSIIILAAAHKENLLPTIISRCQQINLPPAFELQLREEELARAKQTYTEILKSSPGKRIKITEKFNGREEAVLFCQIQLFLWREILVKNPGRETLRIIREIQKTLKYLQANVNVRLAIENLLLSYPSPKTPT